MLNQKIFREELQHVAHLKELFFGVASKCSLRDRVLGWFPQASAMVPHRVYRISGRSYHATVHRALLDASAEHRQCVCIADLLGITGTYCW
uniref:Uncharacterized protein n=1 Tax=Anopheles funestus TaxID=62324 RepID=A0A182RU15_ANOFN